MDSKQLLTAKKPHLSEVSPAERDPLDEVGHDIVGHRLPTHRDVTAGIVGHPQVRRGRYLHWEGKETRTIPLYAFGTTVFARSRRVWLLRVCVCDLRVVMLPVAAAERPCG